MRTYKDLWDKFISPENFKAAVEKACKGKKQRQQIIRFMEDKEGNTELVRQLVLQGKFHTSPYRSKTIYEPKERVIYILPFNPDRIVQHAVMNILRPIMESKFIADSYACIEGRGQLKASIKCSEIVRNSTHIYKGDVRKFYPSIDHDILSGMLHRIVKDDRFMAVVDDIIYSFPGGKNCPIGNYCSQWLGNFYLTELDSFVKHTLHVQYYERYCDDFVLGGKSAAQCHEWRRQIEAFLRDRLLLTCSKSSVFSTAQGVDFCGYRSFGKYTLLRKSTARRELRECARIRRNPEQFTQEEVMQKAASMNGWAIHACTYNFRQKAGFADLYGTKTA